MDKKPFRVTNEELNMLEEMSDAEIGEKMGLVKFIRRLSADLLDSRELIDKQEAIIKEMRSFCKDVADNYDCDSDGHKYNTGCRSCNAKSILEKTKNYA
jgi:hypothetical protein